MNIENTHITFTCPDCGQGVETTLNDVRESPIVTCGACGHEFYAPIEPQVDAAQE